MDGRDNHNNDHDQGHQERKRGDKVTPPSFCLGEIRERPAAVEATGVDHRVVCFAPGASFYCRTSPPPVPAGPSLKNRETCLPARRLRPLHALLHASGLITSAARLMDFSFLFLPKNREVPSGISSRVMVAIPVLPVMRQAGHGQWPGESQ